MPLFSEHIANMYYGSSSPYTGLPYSYSSSVSPLGSSYSASYLNPGGSYSNHSSIGSYSRAPLTSRWITSSGRNYSPMLSTISERGSASPVRINSPRRLPLSTRTYGTPNYTPRPVNINTADIDVSRDKYRHKVEPPTPQPSQARESSCDEAENGPFMPRVDGKPETGIDSSPGVERSTIKRGRTVVRLYTIKRKERDSPRKPAEEQQTTNDSKNEEVVEKTEEDSKSDDKEFMKWREKLSEDLTYKEKKEKKSLGAKLVEKFTLKDNDDKDSETTIEVLNKQIENYESLPATPTPNTPGNKCLDRRCSMELMAEQANLFDSLIKSENLSIATLDLSKVGLVENKNNLETFESIKRRKPENSPNPLKTTKSDYSLHDTLTSYKDVRDPKSFPKRRSIKKSSSGSNIRRLDSITEFPKEPSNIILPAIEESKSLLNQNSTKQHPKPKLKTKITASVEVSAPKSPLKFVVENVIVEETPRVKKKEISYSSEVEEVPTAISKLDMIAQEQRSQVKKTVQKKGENGKELPSPEPESGNFWDKIGKRETVYLMKRKQNIAETKEKHKRALFWFPEDEELDNTTEIKSNGNNESNSGRTKDNNAPNLDTDVNERTNKIASSLSSDNIDTINKQTTEIISTNIESLKQERKQGEQKCVKNAEIVNVAPEIINKVTEVTNTVLVENSTTIEDKIHKGNDKSILESKTAELSQEKMSIGKSASLETINDNKVKIPSQKKTKSEKAKKTLKTEKKFDNKPLPALLPKSNIKPKTTEKTNTNTNCSTDKQEIIEKMTENPKIPCPIHPFGLQKSKELNTELKIVVVENTLGQLNDEQQTIEKIGNSDKQKLPCLVHPLGLQKKNESGDIEMDNNLVSEIDSSDPRPECVNNDNQAKLNTAAPEINKKSTTNKVISKIVDTKEPQSNSSSINKKNKMMTKKSPESGSRRIQSTDKISETTKIEKTDKESVALSKVVQESNKILTNSRNNKKSLNKTEVKLSDTKISNLKIHQKISTEVKSKDNAIKVTSDYNKSKTDEKLLSIHKTASKTEQPSTSNKIMTEQPNVSETAIQKNTDPDSSLINSSLPPGSEKVSKKLVVIESQDIPNEETVSKTDIIVQNEEKTGEENKAENINQKDEQPEKSDGDTISPLQLLTKKPVKEERAVRPLIATPRPLQKKAPQIIHSSDSSDSSSEEESSEEEDDSDSSEGSGEFFECENNPDGRTSTGSNDSGFDSSAPASPATFSQIKKDCDVNCHRKCEKLTANLCGVNQRLLVEALASRTASKKGGEVSATSSSSAPAAHNNTDILEQELEQSTAYDIFRKTGRFTPPARSIPRFRKYTIEDFQFIKVLGKGSFGKVLLAELRDTEYYYAVKCLKKDVVLEDDDVECTLIERKVLALGTNHPYLCHLFATFQTDSHLFFVMEYLNGGDLMFHIQQSGRFPEARGRFYAAEIVSGLKFLHKRGIVYRDLKLDNILLDFEGHVRIADFGMCKLQIYLDKTADTFCGTPDYMAPEIIKGLKYNQTVDWWSFGVLLYEMLIGQSPFSGCDEDELFWSICNEMPSYPRFLSHEALTILTRLLDKDARTRLGGTECMYGDIRDQEFFHPIHWDRLERRELEAPFRPRVRHPMDTQYFDRAFTGERPRLTAVEPHVLRSMDQEPFRGFSYTNPNTTDR